MKDAILNRLFVRYRERGDGRALAAVFDLVAKELLAVAAHLARDAAEAEDLVQVVFLRAMERAESFDRAQGLRPWLHGILWREGLAMRRRAARRADPAELAREPGADPAEVVAGHELPAAVRAALDELPQHYREVVEPLLLEEKPAHEIAAALGRSSGTVRMQIHRGLERLRRALPRGLSLSGVAALPTHGWKELRRSVLREAGASAQAAGALSTGGLVVQAALVAVPVLWLAPLAAGAALVAVQPRILSPWSIPNEPAASVARGATQESDPMKSSTLLALSLIGASHSPAQEPPGREVVATESVADKVAILDALVGELIEISRQENPGAGPAWAGLLAARRRIDAEIHRRELASRPRQDQGIALTKGWVEAVSQLADPSRREQALNEIAAALSSGSPESQIAACRALAQLGPVKFEKQPFRAPVLKLASETDGALRVAALYALHNTVREPEDFALALALADDPSPAVVESGTYLIFLFSDGDLTAAAGEAVERILDRAGPERVRNCLSGLWGARVSPAIEERLLVLSHSANGDDSHDAIYFGLSTLANKSRAVIERLIEAAAHPDPNYHERALWGLGQGVPVEHGALVAEAMKGFFEARSSPRLRSQALCLVGMYGTIEHASWLQGIESDPAEADSVRAAARSALEAVQKR